MKIYFMHTFNLLIKFWLGLLSQITCKLRVNYVRIYMILIMSYFSISQYYLRGGGAIYTDTCDLSIVDTEARWFEVG